MFKNQTELVEAVLRIARQSDKANHHADMEIYYNRLDISITTHDMGSLTGKDYTLSEVIDKILS